MHFLWSDVAADCAHGKEQFGAKNRCVGKRGAQGSSAASFGFSRCLVFAAGLRELDKLCNPGCFRRCNPGGFNQPGRVCLRDSSCLRFAFAERNYGILSQPHRGFDSECHRRRTFTGSIRFSSSFGFTPALVSYPRNRMYFVASGHWTLSAHLIKIWSYTSYRSYRSHGSSFAP